MICAAIIAWAFIAAVKGESLATLPDGTKLQGVDTGAVAYWKGIPYAQPPVGNLRWNPPHPFINLNASNILDATKFGHACTQFLWGDDGLFDQGSEDCLYLNVYAPSNISLDNDPLPVGIFVHGGSYITGASSLPLYEGTDLVNFFDGKAIVVTINYRLNVFGFLGSEALRSQDVESGSTGNYGIQDQRLAFNWVRENIASFGGDSSRVTIYGESAGAGSMSNHMTMKKSWGAFDQVILESGPFSSWVAVTMACAQSVYDQLLEKMRCGGRADGGVACLQSRSDKEILGASMAIHVTSCLYAPVVDGVELTTHPWIALANGDAADVPVILGTNTDEGALFTVLSHSANEEELNDFWLNYGFTQSEIDEHLTDLYVTNKTYPAAKGDPSVYWWAAQRSQGDDFMSCPAKYASQQFASLRQAGKRSNKNFMYHFEHEPRDTEIVRHVSELEYTFHQLELLNHRDDLHMANVMSSYWGNFFNSGNPNKIYIINSVQSKALPIWGEYTLDGDDTIAMRDADDSPMIAGLKKDECDFLIARTDSMIRDLYFA